MPWIRGRGFLSPERYDLMEQLLREAMATLTDDQLASMSPQFREWEESQRLGVVLPASTLRGHEQRQPSGVLASIADQLR